MPEVFRIQYIGFLGDISLKFAYNLGSLAALQD